MPGRRPCVLADGVVVIASDHGDTPSPRPAFDPYIAELVIARFVMVRVLLNSYTWV